MTMAGVSAGAAMFAQRAVFADAGGDLPAANPAAGNGSTSFSSLKQIDAGLLNVGYAEAGPASGPPVILLHGWPNGRKLTDDAIDVFLSILTNGKVTGDNVGPHEDLLASFPYVGAPHNASTAPPVAA